MTHSQIKSELNSKLFFSLTTKEKTNLNIDDTMIKVIAIKMFDGEKLNDIINDIVKMVKDRKQRVSDYYRNLYASPEFISKQKELTEAMMNFKLSQ